MKAHFTLLTALMISCASMAQVHITISNPESWSAEELRPYIGKTVVFDCPMIVSSNERGYTISPRRLFTPTNQAYPNSPAYKSLLALNSTGGITLTNVPSATPLHRCGEKIYNLTAYVNSPSSLTWKGGEFRGNTRADIENTDVRKLVNIADCDECLLVCTMNLEYYIAEQFSSPGPRSSGEHVQQRKKVSQALAKVNADLYGFVEIQQGPNALKEIVSDLNTLLPGRLFTYVVDRDEVNGTYTKSAFVYDSKKLKSIGEVQETAAGSIPAERHRMICFEELATGERFIFSVNHFKAKSGCGTGNDADLGDGQSCNNAKRVAEAQAVMDLYKKYYSNRAIREKDLLVMGDLNAHGKEDPITKFVSYGMVDLHRAFQADSSYSYQFAGLAGYLDHALSNGTLRPQVRGAAGFHINSDESDNYTYDKSNDETMFRCSDHDPVLVGLKLDSTLTYEPGPTMDLVEVIRGDVDKITIFNAYRENQKSFYAIYSINGVLIDRNEITDSSQEALLPLSPGMYIVYLYSDGQVYQRKLIVR